MMEVTAAPAAAPVKRLVVSLERICLSLSPAMSFRAIDMRSMPKRKSARPPSMPINIGPSSILEAAEVRIGSEARISTNGSIQKIAHRAIDQRKGGGLWPNGLAAFIFGEFGFKTYQISRNCLHQ